VHRAACGEGANGEVGGGLAGASTRASSTTAASITPGEASPLPALGLPGASTLAPEPLVVGVSDRLDSQLIASNPTRHHVRTSRR
jgi:hypothetical protein